VRSLVLLFLVGCGDNLAVPDASNGPPKDDAAAGSDAAGIAAPDLRFQWVGASTANQIGSTINVGFASGAGGAMSVHDGHSVISPLQISVDGLVKGNYSWDVAVFSSTVPATGLSSTASTGAIAALDTDLSTTLGTTGVVTSIDIQPDAYAYVVQNDANATYTVSHLDAARSGIDAMVLQLANAGQVPTAVSASPTANQVRVYMTARTGDTTPYETQVVDCTPADFADQANTLAAAGFFITAFGRVANDKMILIGTRSNANPRTTTVAMGDETTTADLSTGAAIVAWIFETADPVSVIVTEK